MTTSTNKQSSAIGKKIRKVGLVLTGISGAILTAAATLPAVVVTVATYLGVLGSLAAAISQALAEDENTGSKNGSTCKPLSHHAHG